MMEDDLSPRALLERIKSLETRVRLLEQLIETPLETPTPRKKQQRIEGVPTE